VYIDQQYIKTIIQNYEQEYISMLCKERMLPDIRDGFRIVQRRIIWAMYNLLKGNNKLIKSANIVGETIKYHPHGDQSIYSSLINMVNDSSNQIIYGKGNWGYRKTLTPSPAAAMRYTEAKFGNFSKKYLHYLKYAKLIVGETNELEPDFIPVPIPYALLYGFHGIVKGIGVSSIYPFKYEDLIFRLYLLVYNSIHKIQKDMEKIKEDIDSKLKNEYPFPFFENLEVKVKDLESIFKRGTGEILVLPKLEVDSKKGTITIEDVCKEINISTAINSLLKNKKLEKIGGLKIKDLSRGNKMKIVLNFHNKYIKNASIDFNSFAKLIKEKLTAKLRYNILVYRGFNDYPIVGVDYWLLYTFNYFLNYHKISIQQGIESLTKKLNKYLLIEKVRPLLQSFLENNKKITSSLLNKFKKSLSKTLSVPEKEINELFSNTTINSLLSIDFDIPDIQKSIRKEQERLNLKNMITETYNFLI